jgi:hypothetical protein
MPQRITKKEKAAAVPPQVPLQCKLILSDKQVNNNDEAYQKPKPTPSGTKGKLRSY